MRRSALGRDDRRSAAAARGAKDDRSCRAGDCDDEAEQRRPDPVTRVGTEALPPGGLERSHEAAVAAEPEPAFEAVLLVGAVGRATARAARPRRFAPGR